MESGQKARRRQLQIEGLRPQIERQLGASWMNVDGRERPRILEDHASSIRELKKCTSKSGQRVAGVIEDPVAVQPKMDVQDASIGQVHELMLSTARNAFDSRTGQGSGSASRQPTLQ